MPLSLAFQNLPPQMRASILMIVALFMFTCMGIFIRLSAVDLPVIEVVFFRNALAVVLLVPLIMRVGWSSMRMQKPKLFFLRAVINFGGMFCGFTALTLIPLAQMTALSFTGPLFVTIGAVLFLGEIIRARRIAAIAVGFLGTLTILQPGFTEISVGALMGSIVLGVIGHKMHPARAMIFFVILWHLSLMLFVFVDQLMIGMMAMLIAGFLQSCSLVPLDGLLMRTSDPKFRGRVMGVRMLAIYTLPISLMVAGWLIDSINFHRTMSLYMVTGVALTLVIAVRWRESVLRKDSVANTI